MRSAASTVGGSLCNGRMNGSLVDLSLVGIKFHSRNNVIRQIYSNKFYSFPKRYHLTPLLCPLPPRPGVNPVDDGSSPSTDLLLPVLDSLRLAGWSDKEMVTKLATNAAAAV